MRFLIVLTAFFLSGNLAFGQNAHLEESVAEVYSQEYAEKLKNSNPGGYEYLMKVSEHALLLDQNPHPKYQSAEILSEIPLRSKSGEVVSIQEFLNDYNSSNFNALKYDFMPEKGVQIFRLAGTNHVLFVRTRSFVMNQNI